MVTRAYPQLSRSHVSQQDYHEGTDDEQEEDAYAEDLPDGREENPTTDPTMNNELLLARENGPENMEHFRALFPGQQMFTKQHEGLPMRSSSPAPQVDQTPSRSRPRAAFRPVQQTFQRANSRPPSQLVNKPAVPIMIPTGFNKTSSYTDSAVEKPPSPQRQAPEPRYENAKKRPLPDELIDYDPDALQAISFADLAAESFDIDPRHISSTSANAPCPTTLSQPTDSHHSTLESLRDLSEPERAEFFSSQTQDQWTASTKFFEDRLAQLFDQLRQARQNRREIARAYEKEVGERMEELTRSGEEIEGSLDEIKGRARGVLPGRGRAGD